MTSPITGAGNINNLMQAQAGGLTRDQMAQLSDPNLSEEDRGRLMQQMKLQNQSEVVAFISNMMKKRNEMAMSVINNLR